MKNMSEETKCFIKGIVVGFLFCLFLCMLCMPVFASEPDVPETHETEIAETGQSIGQEETEIMDEPAEPEVIEIEPEQDAQIEDGTETGSAYEREWTAAEQNGISDFIREYVETLPLPEDVSVADNTEFYIFAACASGMVVGSVMGLSFMVKFSLGV